MTRGHSLDRRFLAWLKVASVAGLRKKYAKLLADPQGEDWQMIAIERALDRAAPALETPRAP